MCKGTELTSSGGYSILDCSACGFVHIDPLPTDTELEGVYREEYYTDEKPEFIERTLEDMDWWETVYNGRFDLLEKKLDPSRRRLLDVGCGPGYFLKRGVERGWNALGVEPSKEASAHAGGLGLEVLNGFFDKELIEGFEREGRRFDAVHLSEVLEHVRDPFGLMKDVYGVLDYGGLVCCVVPNDYSPVQKVLSEKLDYEPYWLAPPHHINYFNAGTIRKLLERVGFEVVEETAMFPMDFFLLMGENYVGDDATGRLCHAKRKRLDMMLDEPGLRDFKSELYRLMARHGIGREIIIYGRKECPRGWVKDW